MTEIIPTKARELIREHLKAKPPQRWQDPDLIRDYVEDMRRGEWIGASDDIVIAGPNGWTSNGTYFPPGTILDGWHRLNAVARSGVAIHAELKEGWA
jgi:hypothetical protein